MRPATPSSSCVQVPEWGHAGAGPGLRSNCNRIEHYHIADHRIERRIVQQSKEGPRETRPITPWERGGGAGKTTPADGIGSHGRGQLTCPTCTRKLRTLDRAENADSIFSIEAVSKSIIRIENVAIRRQGRIMTSFSRPRRKFRLRTSRREP